LLKAHRLSPVPPRGFSLTYREIWWFLEAFCSRKSRLEEMRFLNESPACCKLQGNHRFTHCMADCS
jgi:hypothetical protein